MENYLKKIKPYISRIDRSKEFYIAESIEEKMRRATETGEPIEAVSPMIYTERKQGVLPECDIRTDRWEIAQNAMGAIEKSIVARREEAAKKETNDKKNDE